MVFEKNVLTFSGSKSAKNEDHKRPKNQKKRNSIQSLKMFTYDRSNCHLAEFVASSLSGMPECKFGMNDRLTK
jgi:hypothetical protein